MQSIWLKRLVVAVFLTLVQFSSAYGQEKSFKIFVDSAYPPYMYELENSKAEGLYPRLLKEIITQTGKEVEIFAQPWKRALANGLSGKGGVGGAYRNDERLKLYDYSAPLYQEKLVVFVNKKNTFEFNSIEDLKGKVIGVNRGWSYGQTFDSAKEQGLFEVSERGNPGDNFKMLALGRIDCLILDELSGKSYVRLLALDDLITSLPTAFSMNNGYLIISKELKMKGFLDDFNRTLEEIRKNGTYEKIVQQFIQKTIAN